MWRPGLVQQSRCGLRTMLALLVVSLPLVNPWVRGDGVGYYALARAPLIQHNLDFTADYQHANEAFRQTVLDKAGQPRPEYRTPTGRLDNHFSAGPAILWAPFLLIAHAGVLTARLLGMQVAPDGFSLPYLLAMALATVLYGFFALLLSYHVTCRFVSPRWALLATVTIWWASSLPVYMYFNPSWSHAHSAFTVALFVWYWLRTRENRGTGQWLLLALIAGLMLNVYYPNAMVLAVLIPECYRLYKRSWTSRQSEPGGMVALFARHAMFCGVLLAALFPVFLTKYLIYGSAFHSGYIPVSRWAWSSPSFLALLFSANHGVFSWTPVLLFAAAGLFAFWRNFPEIGLSVLCACLAFYYFMAAYPDWTGISSYGNRFFVSLTIFFVLGLAFLVETVASWFRSRAAASACISVALALLTIWNLGLVFQWGSRMIPARGPVSWKEVAHNQFNVVPRQIGSQFQSYLFRRKDTLRQIEQRDVKQLQLPPGSP